MAALGAYHEAIGVVERLAAYLQDATLRETFITASHVMQIRQRVAAPPPATVGGTLEH
jgi:hypothetical protein